MAQTIIVAYHRGLRNSKQESDMTDKQTGEPQVAGRQGMTRGIFLMGCLVVAALLITIWIKLGSRDVEIELNIS